MGMTAGLYVCMYIGRGSSRCGSLESSTNHKTHLYVRFSSLFLLPPSTVQGLSSGPFSSVTPPTYHLPLMHKVNFHNYIKQQAEVPVAGVIASMKIYGSVYMYIYISVLFENKLNCFQLIMITKTLKYRLIRNLVFSTM